MGSGRGRGRDRGRAERRSILHGLVLCGGEGSGVSGSGSMGGSGNGDDGRLAAVGGAMA